jgi:hypothetical protein
MFGMEKITWPAVVVIVATLGTIIALVRLDQDLTAVGVVIAGLLGLNMHQNTSTKEAVGEVKTNTNGNNQRLVDVILEDRAADRAMIRQMLAAMPPDSAFKVLGEKGNDSERDV